MEQPYNLRIGYTDKTVMLFMVPDCPDEQYNKAMRKKFEAFIRYYLQNK